MLRLLPLLLVVLVAGCGDTVAERPAGEDLPSDFEPRADEDAPLEPAGRWTIARVRERTWLRARPGGKARATIGRRTEFGSRRVMHVVSRRPGWVEVLAPELPNRRTGWVRESAVKLGGTDLWIEVDRSRRRARLMDDERVLRSFPVAVGRPGNETPLGRYAVTDKLTPKEPYSVYGCCAIALTGHQTKLVDGWVGGDRLAIHNTPSTWSIGKAASLGCMRASKADAKALMRRLPLGAPVFVRR